MFKLFNKFVGFTIKFDKDGGAAGSGGGQDGSSQGDDKSGKGKENADGANGGSGSGASGGKKDEGDDSELDVKSLDPKVQKLISDLRKENGDSRKKNKTLSESHDKLKKSLVEAGIIEGDDEQPEEKLKNVTATAQQATFNNAVLEAAVEHGVSKEDLKYFRFLVNEAVSGLEDGGELTDEQITDLAKQAKRKAAVTTTSVQNDGDKKKPGASGNVTVDQFARMNMGEKAAIYTKDKALYDQLFAEAKEKNLLIR